MVVDVQRPVKEGTKLTEAKKLLVPTALLAPNQVNRR